MLRRPVPVPGVPLDWGCEAITLASTGFVLWDGKNSPSYGENAKEIELLSYVLKQLREHVAMLGKLAELVL